MIFNYFLVDLCIWPGEVQKISVLPSIPHYILQVTFFILPSAAPFAFQNLLDLSVIRIPFQQE